MKKPILYSFVFLCILFFQSCSSPQYFHDESSLERQKELQSNRCNNIFCDVMTGIGSIIFSAATDTEVCYIPSDQQFTKLNLINPTADTIYVNMLTDLIWDKNDYCDFMDIRIPPHLNCKVLVPVFAEYNLYFSNTPESDDDELLQINTSNLKRIVLQPGLTQLSKQ